MQRVRTRNYGTIEGRMEHYYNGGFIEYRTLTNTETCTDMVTPGDNWDFTVDRRTFEGGLLNGRICGPSIARVGFNWPLDRYSGSNAYNWLDHLAVSGKPTASELALQLIKRTNPSRPVVDVPVFLAELKDFPELFRIAGSSLLRKTASANLNYQFGWAPLCSDLLKLMHFASHLERRVRELQSLHNRGLRRTVELWRGSNILNNYSQPAASYCGSVTTYVETWVTTVKVTGHVRWHPTNSFPLSNSALRRQAIRAALGLTIDPATAWELIPFSWLIDWCSSVGDYFQANRNIVGASYSNPRIMEHLRTEKFARFVSGSTSRGATFSDARFSRETKTRRVAVPASFSASLPILSGRQMSILGSIGVLSTKDRRR